jgi:UDP:flavonoid glycosyltransferase YjiC (YdhE family)
MLAAADGADLLVSVQSNYAAPLVAEQNGLAWASVMHTPIGLFSAYDPPLLPGYGALGEAIRRLGPTFWKALAWSIKWGTKGWAKPYHRLRAEAGLPRVVAMNPLIDGQSPSLHLALFSPLLMGQQPDFPPRTLVTGFPWYDENGASRFPAELAQFLSDGPPPIVFTLGTAISAKADAIKFFETSAAAAKHLGQRAVLMLNEPRNRPPVLPEGVVAFDYAPFSELFPRAAAIVHHGGIGTTGLAMRAGRPMLIVPWAWDQPDIAARAARLGIARTIPPYRYTASRVAAELRRLLEEPAYSQRASAVADQVQQEDGVRVACDALSALVQSTGSVWKVVESSASRCN